MQQEPRSRPTGLSIVRGGVCERSGKGALVVLVAALALSMAAWLGFREKDGTDVPPVGPEPTKEPEVPEVYDPGAPIAVDVRTPGDEISSSPKPKVFRGRAAIHVEILMARGLEFPKRWQLVIEPAQHSEGRDRAIRKVIDYTDAERIVHVEDLPQAGYRISARAPGLNCVPREEILFEGRAEISMMLKLTPAGQMDGNVFDENGVPCEGLAITIESMFTQERWLTHADAAGNYYFKGVLDGEYWVFFGSPNKPLIPRESMQFAAPLLSYPRRRMPVTAVAEFIIRDELGNPIPQAHITGHGGGPIDTVTDEEGRALVRFLPQGRYNVRVEHSSGRKGNQKFTLIAGETKPIKIYCPQ